jgi:crotonobetainyl-CoA:carnitine CoA-transferase CaiB-like acyl-CoA transferase
MPSVRKKLRIDVDDVRAHAPDIIYVRGHGQGQHGPDADKGSYDSLAYWNRAGVALGCSDPEDDHVAAPPAPAFGDSIGAMTIAGGIMGALYHRERTGEATEVDVSLLGVGMWSMGAAIALSLQLDMPWRGRPKGAVSGNPLVGNYRAKDGRHISLCCLQAGKYWAEACELLGRPELGTDERFADPLSLGANAAAAVELLGEAFAERTGDEWRQRLQGFSGQWAMVQDTIEAAADPQAVANHYVQDYTDVDGNEYRLASPPVQFGNQPPAALRAPGFNEHGDEILESLGIEMDRIIDLKVRGVVA